MAEIIKIKVPTDVLTIEVNDNGDTIVIPVSDERFNKKLIEFADRISSESESISKLSEENADTMSIVDADIKFHTMLHDEFNNLFGEKAYEKVYGEDIIVGAEYVLEFLYKCMPYIQEHITKRAEKLNKYSADRVGSSL